LLTDSCAPILKFHHANAGRNFEALTGRSRRPFGSLSQPETAGAQTAAISKASMVGLTAKRPAKRNRRTKTGPVDRCTSSMSTTPPSLRFGAPWRGAGRDVGLGKSGRARSFGCGSAALWTTCGISSAFNRTLDDAFEHAFSCLAKGQRCLRTGVSDLSGQHSGGRPSLKEGKIRVAGVDSGKRNPARLICRSFRAGSIFYAFPGAALRSTPGYLPGAPSALKSKCLSEALAKVEHD